LRKRRREEENDKLKINDREKFEKKNVIRGDHGLDF